MSGASFQALFEKGTIGIPVSLGSFASPSSTFSSGSLTTSAPIAAGDLVVVGVHNNATNTITVSSISDGTNTYTRATSQVPSANTEVELWYCSNCVSLSSGATITVTFSGSSGASSGFVICAARVAFIIPVSAQDQISGATAASGTSVTTTTPALSRAGEIVFGYSVIVGTPTYTGAAGFTAINSGSSVGNGESFLDYQIVNASAAVTFTPTWNASGLRLAALQATFKGY
jgi:hypothetical protein